MKSKASKIAHHIWSAHEGYLAKESVSTIDAEMLCSIAETFCPGASFQYILDSPSLTMEHFSGEYSALLGLKESDFTLSSLIDTIHKDSIQMFLRCEDLVAYFIKNCINPADITNYKIVSAIGHKRAGGGIQTLLKQTRVLSATESGALLKVFGVHTLIDHITTEPGNRLSFIGCNGLPSFYVDDVFAADIFSAFKPINFEVLKCPFSKREIQLLKLLSKGMSTLEISQELAISEHTVITHRKNMMRKSQAKNTADLVAQSIRLGHI